jgi:peptide deformylase
MNDENSAVKIYTFPDPILRKRANTIENIDEQTHKLANQMIQTMYGAPGIGLAANQVGHLNRLIVFDLYPGKEERKTCVLINPEIVLSDDEEVTTEEACLSVIDFSAEVTRKKRVKVKGVDLDGKPMDIEAEGLLAICLQHEIDHLNGRLYIDHISSLKRALYKKKLKKMLQNK